MSTRAPVLISPGIVQAALEHFSLPDKRGVHGPSHWGRVADHGRVLAQQLGESPLLPTLFGLLHDCCRENEDEDPEHGPRADDFIVHLCDRPDWPLDGPRTRLLRVACRDHSEGYVKGPLIVQICWDADRLDLGRVGMVPDPKRLCTEAARERIDLAVNWARGAPLRTLGKVIDDRPVRRRWAP